MSLPDLTDLQFLVLSPLFEGEKCGRELREFLHEQGVRKSSVAHYQLLTRMEEAGIIVGRYVDRDRRGQKYWVRMFKITAAGKRAFQEKWQFFQLPRTSKIGAIPG